MFHQRALGALLICGQAEPNPQQGVEERSAVAEGLEVAMLQAPQVNWVPHSQKDVQSCERIKRIKEIGIDNKIVGGVLAFQEKPIVAGDVEEVCEGIKKAVRGSGEATPGDHNVSYDPRERRQAEREKETNMDLVMKTTENPGSVQVRELELDHSHLRPEGCLRRV